MDNFTDIFNQIGSPYTDIISVALLLAVTAVFCYVIIKLTEKRQEHVHMEAEAPAEPEQAAVSDTSAEHEVSVAAQSELFRSSVPPGEADAERTEHPKAGTEITQEAAETEETSVFRSPSEGNDIHAGTELEEPAQVEEDIVRIPEAEKQEEEVDFFSRLRKGLSKTNAGIFGKLDSIFTRGKIDADLWDDFEESLITSDIGVSTTMKLRENIESRVKKDSLSDPSGIRDELKSEICAILKNVEAEPLDFSFKPTIIMVAGANGVGKTTTIGKLANKFSNDGRKVMIAAGDTFRAAAVEQLEIWAKRVGADFIKAVKGADPSAVAFDAVQSAVARKMDVLIIDTAGRLHNKANLMDELSKIRRVVSGKVEGAPHEVLLVLDATTGQNAVQQAKTFKEVIDVSGIVLTKLDGTARGGVIVAIADELRIPVKYIGIGEALEDLRRFEAEEFVEALFVKEGETVH